MFKYLQLTNYWGKPTNLNFYEWLVGFTDGDGTFGNRVTLEYIHNVLRVGNVTTYGVGRTMSRLQVQDRPSLTNVICPIFDNYPLFTFQQYRYDLFKKGLYLNNKGPLDNNDKLIVQGLKDKLNASVSSNNPAILQYIAPHGLININPSISWLIGFIEAEGCFTIHKISSNRYDHRFSITQKADIHLLVYIKYIFNISSTITPNRGINTLQTNKFDSILTIIDIFKDNLAVHD